MVPALRTEPTGGGVHHIKHVDEFPELAYEDNNLVSLCQACHNKAHPEKARAATAGRLR